MHRVLSYNYPSSATRSTLHLEFYREEIIRHKRCLEKQREYYSERAVSQVDVALNRLLEQLDVFCSQRDADQVLSRLLRKIDVVTGLSAWSDPKKVN